MDARERFLETMTFGNPDGIFYWCRGAYLRQATLDRWFKEGLPAELGRSDSQSVWQSSWRNVRAYLGFDSSETLPVDFRPVPRFQEVILEEDERYQIWIDEMGAKRLDFRVQPEPGFQTRTWLEFPVKKREDFIRMAERYDPHAPSRYPADWEDYVQSMQTRDYPLRLAVPSLFGTVREWMGLGGMAVCFYDDPQWMHEMMEFMTEFIIEATRRAVEDAVVDWVMLFEDMAYKTAPMISPAMVREFMLPRYKRIAGLLRDRGVDVIVVDSDGHVNELIPLWLEAGINGLFPLEVAAGMDPMAIRKEYGRDLALIGGIDKRELAKDKEAVRREVMSKVPYLLQQGGHIPLVDHAVPPDIPYENFCYFLEVLRSIESEVFG